MNLKFLRNEKNLTQSEIAEELGVSLATVSSWETGRTQPNLEMLRKLSGILCVTVDELITIKNTPKKAFRDTLKPTRANSNNQTR